ncbi:hypothetical protein [uncultured Bacteroides sp.]|uniref:hypothetical protein n=1 Tax=uncultured Bacteroides sp. TaxID=162156 RepID=UPI002AAB12FA|nr:hypothetical protein [uncultured Bacteroides sp.]
MRKTTIDATTIEYPDEIGFCFNPVVINLYGYAWSYIKVSITDVDSETLYTEKRQLFNTSCFFDLSPYAQGMFDLLNFSKVDYTLNGSQDSKTGRLFSVEVDMYKADDRLGNSFQFNTFIIWGAMKVGEQYNGIRTLTWFKKFPFSVGMYCAAASNIKVYVDSVLQENTIATTARKVWNLMLKGLSAESELIFELPASGESASVWDNTFDFTFKGLLNTASHVRLNVDETESGVYLRWINRHGFYCYWLFQSGDESRQVSNDGEFIRNNMVDYSYVNGYHGGSGRKQRKTENNTLPVCAPLVDSDTYDFLFQLALSPVVDMYAGDDSEGVPQWKGVNVSVATFMKTKATLQDFIATIILPETSVQSL